MVSQKYPPEVPTLTLSPPHSSLLTSRHYIGSHSCDHFSLPNLINRSFRLPLHLSLSSLLSYLTSSLSLCSRFYSFSSFPSSHFLHLSLLPSLPFLPLPSPSPPLPPHTPHRKVMPRLSVLKWDNWTCWRQDQRRTAPSRLSR